MVILLVIQCALLYAGDAAGAKSPAYEFAGQVINPTATTSVQYGYLSLIPGLDSVSTQTGALVSEATALLTFYNETTNQQTINNGPFRIVSRTGTATIYFNPSGGGDFNNPDTFRAGKPVQTCNLRHQVLLDTVAGSFTVRFEMTITSTHVFEIAGASYRLGRPGEVYHWTINGKLNAQAPPAAHIVGFASGGSLEAISVE